MIKKVIYFVLSLSVLYMGIDSYTFTQKITTDNGICQEQFLEIGGKKQYVLIRGVNKNNPVLLFLHGGPGASATALLRKLNNELEKHFTVVYWDQRGAGKSYDKSIRKEDITVKSYIKDTHELTDYLKKQLHKEKIFLIGHSWGSRLGMYVINEKPENYYAYMGVGQEVESYRGELYSYQYSLKRAKETNNKKAIQELMEIGEPQSGEYAKMYKNGFWGLVKQKDWLLQLGGERYQKTNYTDWILSIWFSDEYSFLDLIRYGKASGFSVGNIIYDPDFNNLNLFKQVPEVKIPVFFISGKYDYNTPWEIAKEYCDSLKAPGKKFVLFDQSGHSPVFEEPEKFNREVIKLFTTKK